VAAIGRARRLVSGLWDGWDESGGRELCTNLDFFGKDTKRAWRGDRSGSKQKLG